MLITKLKSIAEIDKAIKLSSLDPSLIDLLYRSFQIKKTLKNLIIIVKNI